MNCRETHLQELRKLVICNFITCTHFPIVLTWLTIKRPMIAYANAQKKIPLEIHYIYLGNKEIYCIFKTCCIISVLFSTKCWFFWNFIFFFSNTFFLNPLNAELNPICYLLALLGVHHFLHVSWIRVKSLTLRLLMSYIYIYICIYIYDISSLRVNHALTFK